MNKSKKLLAILLAMSMTIAGTGAAYAAEPEEGLEQEQVQIEQSADEMASIEEAGTEETEITAEEADDETAFEVSAEVKPEVKAQAGEAILIENDDLLYKTTGSDTVELFGIGDNWAATHEVDDYEYVLDIPSSLNYAGRTYRVTSIGDNACRGRRLIRLTIPSSVVTIGDFAFEGALIDVDITIPNSVKTIGKYAFCGAFENEIYGSDNLSHNPFGFEAGTSNSRLTLGSGIEVIGEGAFAGQKVGGTLVIPARVKSIGEYAFYDCMNISSVDNRSSAAIPATATDFGKNTKTEVVKKAKWECDGQLNTVCDICGSRYRDSIWLMYEDGILKSNTLTYNGKVRKPVANNYLSIAGYYDWYSDLGNKEIKITCPASKGVGTYTAQVTISSKYAEGTESVTYKIVPKGTTQKTPAAGKKSFTAKWAKQKTKMSKSRITGYQIRYSTSSTMSKAVTKKVKGYAKTSVKVGKLKAHKKYYVQVRTYMVKNGKTYYSPWSAKKSVTTK